MKTLARRAGSNGTGALPAVVRVGIYTRQSVADDLEFNSLDAQRQAIENYVKAQASLGWEVLPERYDDHGFSGGTIERPAFKRLLEHVKERRVDVIAVHRLDRLSRSIGDFVRVMEFLAEYGVSLVSTTQAFDTGTSLGRMTVNLLATFATYERDLIRERTQEKMAATRKRGMYTGGPPPLGYRVVEKKLVPNEAEAERVREVFRLFLELESVMATSQELNRRGWTTRTQQPFDKERLRKLLTNPIYRGLVLYRGETYPGVHEAIIDEAMWEAAQKLLSNSERAYRAPTGKTAAVLRGLLFCGTCGSTMTPHFSQKRGRRHFSYVCRKYEKRGASACPGSRVPLAEIERFVVERIRAIGKDPGLVGETIEAARWELKARRPALEAELAGLEKEHAALDTERGNLLDAVSKNGSGSAGLLGRLGDVEGKLGAVSRRVDEARAELTSIDGQAIDGDDLKQALAQFDPVWDALLPAEKARIVQLLIERVSYDARVGEIEISFRPGGIKALAVGEGKPA